jgi:hypothetical protein
VVLFILLSGESPFRDDNTILAQVTPCFSIEQYVTSLIAYRFTAFLRHACECFLGNSDDKVVVHEDDGYNDGDGNDDDDDVNDGDE